MFLPSLGCVGVRAHYGLLPGCRTQAASGKGEGKGKGKGDDPEEMERQLEVLKVRLVSRLSSLVPTPLVKP